MAGYVLFEFYSNCTEMTIEEEMKICSACKQSKPLSCFGKNVNTKDGLRGECKLCYNSRMRLYNSTHKEKKNERDRIYRNKNKKTINAKITAYKKEIEYEKSPQRKTWKKEYEQTPKRKAWKQQYMREYGKKPKRKEYLRSLYRRKWDTDENYKIARLLRGRLQYALKNKSTPKSLHALDILGCSIDFLKEHLSSLFEPGMTWKNNTKFGWHIDHILPVDHFDLRDEAQQRICFHWTNLQPLWANDNLVKGAKVA